MYTYLRTSATRCRRTPEAGSEAGAPKSEPSVKTFYVLLFQAESMFA